MPTFKHPCPVCGKFIQRDVAACPFCGRSDPFAPARCPECNAPIELSYVACPSCGVGLQAGIALPPPQPGPASGIPVREAPFEAQRPTAAEPPSTTTMAAPPPAAPPPAPSSTGACTACGAALAPGARFCTVCGTLTT
jgi:hypothetical protein